MSHRNLIPALAASLAVVVSACGASGPALVLEGATMGTRYRVRVDDAGAGDRAQELGELVQNTLDRIDGRMSTWSPDSEVSRFNASGSVDPVVFSDETFSVLQAAVEQSARTGGTIDPTVGPLVDAWGFGPAGSAATAPTQEEVAALRARIGYDKLELDPAARTVRKLQPGLQIDLSAIAKGYAVDAVSEALEEAGLAQFLVEVGGEGRTRGRTSEGQPWRIGIERPEQTGDRAIERLVPLTDLAMATSGNYRNFYLLDGATVAHTIDPRTGRPVEHPGVSVSVVAETCMQADGLATALMVMGPTEGLAWAEERDLAVLYLVWDGAGFVDRATESFRALGPATAVQ